MFSLPRLLLATSLPLIALGQTQIELDQSRYTAPWTGAVTRSGASKLSDTISVKDFGAAGDGATDDLPAINKAITFAAGKGERILFPAGTYMVSGTIVLPDKTSIIGVGRGDANYINTVIKALPTFTGSTVIQMGASSPSFGIQVERLTIDGSAVAGTCLSNSYAEEQSYGRDLLLTNCGAASLVISGSGAQNSGPFEDLEIYPGSGSTVNTNSMCVQVTGVLSFRGIRGVTCNAGSGYASRPAIGLALDGDGHYSDIHVEHVATAISLGSSANSADGLVLSHAQFGPDVATGVAITSLNANQNLSIFGLSCVGCSSLLSDALLGTNITDTSVGWYMIGNGAGAGKPMLSGNNGVGAKMYGPLQLSGNASVGPSNPRTNATVSIYDASPSGVTSVVEVAGANQGGTNLFEWHNSSDTPMVTIGSNGAVSAGGFWALNNAMALGNGGMALGSNVPVWWTSGSTWNTGNGDVGLARASAGTLEVTNGSTGLGTMEMASLQLASSGSQPTCASGNRGVFWFTQSASGTADHLQVCAKSASDSYGWTTIF